jgi:peptide-methionine (S)-S-oxide reductase
MHKATFAAGCFWGIEAAFRKLDGVTSTRVGYTGGSVEDPSYGQVCSRKTGHAEAVEVTYESAQISYEDLLAVFWSSHNPRTRNRQGFDIGNQYRSAIFFHDPAQEAAAREAIERLDSAARFRKPIVTEVVPATTFWEAEQYHQQYLEKRGAASCNI